MPVSELHDLDQLQEFLMRDRVGNAYLIGDLDEAYLPYCTWYGLTGEEGSIRALALLYTGLSIPALLTVGPPELTTSRSSFDALFSYIRPKLPPRFWVHAWEHHRPSLDKHFHTGHLQRMIRMSLGRDDYQAPAPRAEARRLGHGDTAAIMQLYHYYPDNFFEPYQLETGLYFGVDSPDNKGLAAIAGIHVFSKTHDIAAIGNLVVHPNYRRRGYATTVTGRLLAELFSSLSLVTLNVLEGNEPAIGTYEKFGFHHHHVYYEGIVNIDRPF
jgi:ribosomal protein S18 acetylase RimI-like enzyme